MSKIKYLGLAGVMAASVTCALGSGPTYAASACTATSEEELYAALADVSCNGVITLNASEIQDKGIQLTKDFDGEGATLMMGTSSYGLLAEEYGLDGHAGVPTGAGITISNVTIIADADSKALINIDSVATVLENVTTDRTATDGLATPNYYAHIDVKNSSNLTLRNYDAAGGAITIDYSPKTTNKLTLDMDENSMAAVTDVPAFISAYGDGTISASTKKVLDFLNSDTLIMAKDDTVLTADDKSALILPTPESPYLSTPITTGDGREVVLVENGATDTHVASIADSNEEFAGFVSRLDDDAIFLALDDRGDCDSADCAVTVTVASLEALTKYYLYHYDDEGNVELVGDFMSDESGSVEVKIEKFSGNVLTTTLVELAGDGPLVPETGVMGILKEEGGARLNSMEWLLLSGAGVAIMTLIIRKAMRVRR